MKNSVRILILIFCFSMLGCAQMHTLKSPCNESGSNCEPRMKINESNYLG